MRRATAATVAALAPAERPCSQRGWRRPTKSSIPSTSPSRTLRPKKALLPSSGPTGNDWLKWSNDGLSTPSDIPTPGYNAEAERPPPGDERLR